MQKGQLKIHSQNILPIIKKWLYSDKDIFVRELVSNACDALTKLNRLIQEGQATDNGEQRIDVTIDTDAKTLTFSDTGLGMTQNEVETYIAQIAFSGAEDFVKKYESDQEKDQVIGHFGLGFYSSYMVAKNVQIDTLSYQQKADAVLWECDGSTEYSIGLGKRSNRGTTITLFLSDDEQQEYLDQRHIEKILKQYCRFLPFPIFLNNQRINEKEPLWTKPATECTEKEYYDFYQQLFPTDPEPLFWIHLNVDYPFHLKGILYFPKITNDNDLKKESIQLYCNRVFVSDNCKDLLPEYLMVLRGVIDSPDIPLNVSRSYLQMDKTVRQLGAHLSKKISDRLSSLYRSDREKFINCWEDIELIIKYGALQDEKFYERIKDFLIWKNEKDEWTTVQEYMERSNSKTVYYAPPSQSHERFLELFKESGLEVLKVHGSPIDSAVLQLLESKTEAQFQRIDSSVEEKLIDSSKGAEILDVDGKTASGKLADFFRNQLGSDHMEVEAKSLTSSSLPGVLLIKEQERRLRDTLRYHQKDFPQVAGPLVKPTLVLNSNNKLIQAIYAVREKDLELAKEMVHEVYDLVRLSQREMEPEALNHFIERSTSILERLSSRLVGVSE